MRKELVEKSFARITLFLDIVEKLPNGFHRLDTVKQSIDLYDIIKIKESSELDILCNPFVKSEENIIFKVINAFKKKYSIKDNVKVYVEKRIPMGAGLAGGSSNAAHALMALNKLWRLNLDKKELIELVEENYIGKDVPYFFYKGTAHDTETNSNVIKILNSMPKTYVILAKPDIEISSKEAYDNYDRMQLENKRGNLEEMLDAVNKKDRREIAENLYNAFEDTIIQRYPKIKNILDTIEKNGCLASKASLTGSGSCVFGLYDNLKNAEKIREKLDGLDFVYLTKTH